MHALNRRAAALALLAIALSAAILAFGGAAGAAPPLAQSTPPPPTPTPAVTLRFPLAMRMPPGGVGVVAGWVVDATTNAPVAGAWVCRADGSPCATTNSNGEYRLGGLPVGASNLRVTATGYDTLLTRVDVVAGETRIRTLALSPPLQADQWRFVLTWDAQPPDLDLFLWLPDETAVFWGGRGDCDPNPPTPPVGACLEQDSRDGYGPETVTITDLRGGGYYTLGVHRYDDPTDTVTEPSISASRARLHVYNGEGLQLEFRIPAGEEGQFWYVLDLDETGLVTPFNAISDHNPYTGMSGAFSIRQHGLPVKDR